MPLKDAYMSAPQGCLPACLRLASKQRLGLPPILGHVHLRSVHILYGVGDARGLAATLDKGGRVGGGGAGQLSSAVEAEQQGGQGKDGDECEHGYGAQAPCTGGGA